MQMKIKKIRRENTLCSFNSKGVRLQLIELWNYPGSEFTDPILKYQVLLNRKIKYTNKYEYEARKHFATYCQNIVLQLKLY